MDAGTREWFAALCGTPRLVAAGAVGEPLVADDSTAWSVDDTVVPLRLTARDVPVAPAAARPGVDAATALLRAAVGDALTAAAGEAPGTWTESMARALAILGSDGTGEELSDVAWPHFLLPGAYSLQAQRLAAAAATAWQWDAVGAWSGERADAVNEPLRQAVEAALVAAV